MFRTITVAAAALCAVAATAFAQSTPYEPPEGGDSWQKSTVVLKGAAADKDAAGKAVFACNAAETQHRVQLSAQKVEKGGVYSVWLIKYDAKRKKNVKEQRVDNPKRPLKADKYGKLSFTSNLSACPQGRYTGVEVRYHADGKADNVKGAKVALSGKLP